MPTPSTDRTAAHGSLRLAEEYARGLDMGDSDRRAWLDAADLVRRGEFPTPDEDLAAASRIAVGAVAWAAHGDPGALAEYVDALDALARS